ncbi:hypothetical protein Dsin_030409 [Dipteronia sinensis]|uniref:RNase H type-1 domain-containing protein n=1 Tax=Dipteronia sinensis TaxID=43782 RepID=A0AAE0DR35_9ROSI|nr:hypothetical protein Dsin_030409 [Dipteronia sinensis]
MNTISSLANLWKRKFWFEPSCPRCGAAVETSDHACFWCGEAWKIWGWTLFDGLFDDLKMTHVMDMFSSFLRNLNTDVAIRGNSMSIGLGAAIRDDKGKVIVACSKSMVGSFGAEIEEFLALRGAGGLPLTKFYNIPVKIAEVDASNVASILNSTESFLGDAKFIVNDIKALFLDIDVCKCQAIPRSGNSLAYNLALLAFSFAREQI